MWSLLIGVFLLNIISSTMGVLNTILISKNIMKPVFFIMFVDCVIFTTGMKLVSNGEGYYIVFAFAAGKVIGALCATHIEEKLALGLLEVTVFAKYDKAIALADNLRLLGYGVTTIKGYGSHGVPRFSVDITIKRKEMNVLAAILDKYGYDEATTIIKEIKKVTGKIKTSHQPFSPLFSDLDSKLLKKAKL